MCGRDDPFFSFCSSLDFWRKLNIYGRDDPFFALHLILGGKLDICGRDDLFSFLLFQSVRPLASKFFPMRPIVRKVCPPLSLDNLMQLYIINVSFFQNESEIYGRTIRVNIAKPMFSKKEGLAHRPGIFCT